jgi:hypothetical protein
MFIRKFCFNLRRRMRKYRYRYLGVKICGTGTGIVQKLEAAFKKNVPVPIFIAASCGTESLPVLIKRASFITFENCGI